MKSKDAKKAHSMNSITIEFFGNNDNAYIPIKHKIVISPNSHVLSLIKDFGGIENASANIQKKQVFAFKDEITEKRIKGTIYHELSHWVDDSLNNFHITTMLNKANSNLKNFQKILAQDGADSIDSFYEINAQIHALKQYKKSIKPGLWNRLKWSDVERIITSINNISEKLKSRYGLKEYNRWKKEILKRMSREGLIGKNMKFN